MKHGDMGIGRVQMLKDLKCDSLRYADFGGRFAHPGFWIVAMHRFGVWGDSLANAFLSVPARALCRLARFAVRIIFNFDFWAGSSHAHFGMGLYLIHPNNIIIANGVEIGEDCLIHHEDTHEKL